ncbi:glycosyltransferase family 25 protein [Mesorhizobium sp. CGMCC 1.15528]|uniref:Glycosyltransferase family 25 protein n=1 Tax=Mesorhizobium zhangyense TaxID=1776730 RepID=A0A7C9V6R5_9HYPH|nr:glycosyltransferase family 25 protein [Mesorhizobium zhangyense]NGN41223.1 glycosyltransferase family 25 protein [Mesorhizobium zhangyense]
MNAEAFIIHLQRAEGRRPQVEALKAMLPLTVNVIDAVDGLKLSESDIGAVYRRNVHRPRYPFELRAAEVGCFLSHRKAWQEIVDRGLDAGLIVEDDVQPEGEGFREALTMALKTIKPGDYIRFPYRSHTDKGREVAGWTGAMLVEPDHVGLGMQMQLVGRDAAAELLKATEIFDRPVDTTIQMRWLTKARILSVSPVCIRQIDHLLGGTVVQKKSKPLGEVISREIKRAAYRLSLRAVSYRNRPRRA